MIDVDIFLPGRGETMEFRCNEVVKIKHICRGILCSVKTNTGNRQDVTEEEPAAFWLCSMDSQAVLSGERTLKEYGIKNGSKLIFL